MLLKLNSAFVGNYFQWWINLGQQVYVGLSRNKQHCVFMVINEHVTQCNSAAF